MKASSDLRASVDTAMAHPEAAVAVRDIYTRLQVEIDRRKPICAASGRCCNFESYGHRLYVTTLELAAFMQDHVTRASGPCGEPERSKRIQLTVRSARAGGPCYGDGCPLQVDGLCSVHPIRPFGCRIFFCDPTADDWQKQQYELFHAQLKQLHDRFEIPYMYVEWRAALASLDMSGHRDPEKNGSLDHR